jgi:glycerol-1-phosphate dehydrogenase [NAD(P)+]
MPAGDPIEQLLAGRYPDPETGELLGCEARSVAIEDSLEGRELELVAALGLGSHFAVIGDVDTYAALGERVASALESRFTVQRVVLGAHPHCDVPTIDAVGAGLDDGTDAVIAVGSGTINDISKMVGLARGIPQLVFGTAPSMNGYTSVSASVSDRGFKRSLRARTPTAVFLDLSVLAAAPKRLIRAGLGDSVCRPTAQTDWLMSHLLIDTPYRTVPFVLLEADEPRLFGDAAALVGDTRDLSAMRALARTLVLSGFGMTLAGGSYPASQGEHLVSHYLEMMKPAHLAEAHHGEQIGVAAIAIARIQHAILSREAAPFVQPTRITRDDVIAHFARRELLARAVGEGARRHARRRDQRAPRRAVARDSRAPRRIRDDGRGDHGDPRVRGRADEPGRPALSRRAVRDGGRARARDPRSLHVPRSLRRPLRGRSTLTKLTRANVAKRLRRVGTH